MAFKTLTDARPARRWALVGFPGDGKSSFSAQMRTPILPVDVDSRYAEVKHLASGPILSLSDDAQDNSDVQAIDKQLALNMRGSGVKTIVVDSVTPIFSRITRRHSIEVRTGTNAEQNKSAIHAEKVDAMSLLGTAVSAYGTDTLFIWHLNETTFNGKKTIDQTLSSIEFERLWKHLNALLEIVVDRNDPRKRGIKIIRARAEHAVGKVLWDTDENRAAGTFWKGMPERIEDTLYPKGGQNTRPATIPAAGSDASSEATADKPRFASPDEAIEWGVKELGLTAPEVTEIYNTVKTTAKPKTARDMWAAWEKEIETRKQALASLSTGKF